MSPNPARDAAHPSISCVMPAYNEAANLQRLISEVLATLRSLGDEVELIVVDDGSRDETPLVLAGLCKRHPQLVALHLSRNFGKEIALSAGLDAAGGDVVVLMDADGQHPPSLLPAMLARWREGADVVYAVRATRTDQGRLQSWMTDMFYRFINLGTRVRIPPNAGDFRLMDTCVVEALRALPERNRFMKGLYAWVGFTSAELEYAPPPRQFGKSSFGLRGALSLATTGVLAFSTVPLRVFGILGLVMACLAMFYGLAVIVEYFWFGIDVPGYATIVVGIMFFSGLQLLSLGVLSEYVARIYQEVKQRPLYFVRLRDGRGLGRAHSAAPAAPPG